MTYNKKLIHKYINALHHAAEKHLTLEGDISTHHFNDPRAEINNETCVEAFIKTFRNHFCEESKHLEYEHEEHHHIIAQLNLFTEHAIQRLKGEIEFASLVLNASTIIASYSLEQ